MINTKNKTIKAVFTLEINDDNLIIDGQHSELEKIFNDECDKLGQAIITQYSHYETPAVDWEPLTLDLNSLELRRMAYVDNDEMSSYIDIETGEIYND